MDGDGRDTEELRRKERANKRFAREELGDLLRLFSALGVTVGVGITGFFLLGLWLDRHLQESGWHTHGIPRIICVITGIALSLYWAYLRIARHLRKYEDHSAVDKDDPNYEL